MATSGSSNYSLNRNQIVNTAFKLAGILGRGRTLSSEDLSDGIDLLNMMIKSPEFQNLHLWTQVQGVLFIEKNTVEYTLGNSSSYAKACLASDAVITQTSVAAASAATSLTVDSTTGMTVGDIIGIVVDDNTTHWTTIATIPSSTTLTITDALDDDAAIDSNVYTFTSRITKPLRIHNVRRCTGIDNGSIINRSEVQMASLSDDEYFNIPTKTTSGTPTSYYYKPDLTFGTFYIWSAPDNGDSYLRFTFSRMIEDFDSSSDDPDFPSEWTECLTWNLALRLCVLYSKPQKQAEIAPIAMKALNDLNMHDAETQSITFSPESMY